MSTSMDQDGLSTTAGLPTLLTAEQVSQYLGVPLATLYRWRHQGSGPRAVRVGRHLRYEAGEVRTWLRERVV